MLQRKLDRRNQETKFVAGIVTFSFENAPRRMAASLSSERIASVI